MMSTEKNSGKKLIPIMIFFIFLSMTSCSLDRTNAAETEDSIEYTTVEPVSFSCGRYYPNTANLEADVYLEITDNTIALIGNDTDIKCFFKFLWEKNSEPIDEKRLNTLISEWKNPREYIVHTSSHTFIVWEWANDESQTMISGGHFDDETHFEFYSVIFEYKEE
ncbi:MAG: hypothetical protein K2I06_11255 [Ruminococcus sp.]|nr:hypothetical protein [Ruminococcus sp.]